MFVGLGLFTIIFIILFKITPIKLHNEKIKKYFLFFDNMPTHIIAVIMNIADPSVVINFIIVVN